MLYDEWTSTQRSKKLSEMGFNVRSYSESFGINQLVGSVTALTALIVFLLTVVPWRDPSKVHVFLISVIFSIQIGVSILMSTMVAHRFLQREESGRHAIRLLAELIGAGIIVVGMSAIVRVGVPVISSLIESGTLALDESIRMFKERAAGLLVPFVCTLSLGLLCSYTGKRSWHSGQLIALGAICNGLALALTGVVVARLLDEKALGQLPAGWIVSILGVTGAATGGMILAMFRKSERVSHANEPLDVKEPEAPAKHVPTQISAPEETAQRRFLGGSQAYQAAPKELGGYSRDIAEELEGRYVCFRPMFSNPKVINAYLTIIVWDQKQSCLTFEEQSRADSGYVQKGSVYIPDGKPYMNLVTLNRGAIRTMIVSRPDVQGLARGLVMTLSNSGGMHFTPASAPVVLRRLGEQTPQLGFIHPSAPDYELYRAQIESVLPDFGVFAKLQALGLTEHPADSLAEQASEGRLTIVR